ncbi:cytochrome C oxidase subunit IV family protein [Paraflavitalea speifideaquila]|uniref:cytochrome C oxidase subunit IV family protein n=1 Tax=Paraflavitalea speifideaquila TaxID=3076558 RepID=UPI0028EA3DE4|nr:cytochrome C oxidase subunit IV family protein [Paraflavitalea speifideiaquila]
MEKFETPHNAEHGHGEKHDFDTKAIWRTFWILLIITCLELVVGMFIAPHFHSLKLMFNILYIIFTAAKAFYIIAEFMHLRHEIKNMIMTIAVPALLFIWFIAAFLWDGNSYKTSVITMTPTTRRVQLLQWRKRPVMENMVAKRKSLRLFTKHLLQVLL